MFGKETTLVTSAPAGDIIAAAKLVDTKTGDTLAPKHKPVKVPPIDRPSPVLATSIVAVTQSDDDKLGSALHRILDEDSSLKLKRNDEPIRRFSMAWVRPISSSPSRSYKESSASL